MQALLITEESSILRFTVMSATQLTFLIIVIGKPLKKVCKHAQEYIVPYKTSSIADFTMVGNLKVHIRCCVLFG